jgi:hypothetical protein
MCVCVCVMPQGYQLSLILTHSFTHSLLSSSTPILHITDDTAEKIMVRIEAFNSHVGAIQDMYADCTISVNGNQAKDVVFSEIVAGMAE